MSEDQVAVAASSARDMKNDPENLRGEGNENEATEAINRLQRLQDKSVARATKPPPSTNAVNKRTMSLPAPRGPPRRIESTVRPNAGRPNITNPLVSTPATTTKSPLQKDKTMSLQPARGPRRVESTVRPNEARPNISSPVPDIKEPFDPMSSPLQRQLKPVRKGMKGGATRSTFEPRKHKSMSLPAMKGPRRVESTVRANAARPKINSPVGQTRKPVSPSTLPPQQQQLDSLRESMESKPEAHDDIPASKTPERPQERTVSMPVRGPRRVESTVRPNAARPKINSPVGQTRKPVSPSTLSPQKQQPNPEAQDDKPAPKTPERPQERTVSMPVRGPRRVESTVRPNAARPKITTPIGRTRKSVDSSMLLPQQQKLNSSRESTESKPDAHDDKPAPKTPERPQERTVSMPIRGPRRVESTVRPNAARPKITTPIGRTRKSIDSSMLSPQRTLPEPQGSSSSPLEAMKEKFELERNNLTAKELTDEESERRLRFVQEKQALREKPNRVMSLPAKGPRRIGSTVRPNAGRPDIKLIQEGNNLPPSPPPADVIQSVHEENGGAKPAHDEEDEGSVEEEEAVAPLTQEEDDTFPANDDAVPTQQTNPVHKKTIQAFQTPGKTVHALNLSIVCEDLEIEEDEEEEPDPITETNRAESLPSKGPRRVESTVRPNASHPEFGGVKENEEPPKQGGSRERAQHRGSLPTVLEGLHELIPESRTVSLGPRRIESTVRPNASRPNFGDQSAFSGSNATTPAVTKNQTTQILGCVGENDDDDCLAKSTPKASDEAAKTANKPPDEDSNTSTKLPDNKTEAKVPDNKTAAKVPDNKTEAMPFDESQEAVRRLQALEKKRVPGSTLFRGARASNKSSRQGGSRTFSLPLRGGRRNNSKKNLPDASMSNTNPNRVRPSLNRPSGSSRGNQEGRSRSPLRMFSGRKLNIQPAKSFRGALSFRRKQASSSDDGSKN